MHTLGYVEIVLLLLLLYIVPNINKLMMLVVGMRTIKVLIVSKIRRLLIERVIA